jgi:serine protease AprX
MRRIRASALLAAGLLSASALAATGPTAGAVSNPPRSSVQLDSTLPVHPALQYGAQAEPNKLVRVIVQKDLPESDAHDLAASAGAAVNEEFSFVKSAVLELPQKDVLKLAHDPHVRYISPDAPVKQHTISTSNLTTTYPLGVSANRIWNDTTGLAATGQGVTVAVIDTGFTANPDFPAGKVTAVNLNKTALTATDGYGHGTPVAGIIAAKNTSGQYLGVAPDANIVAVKIADDAGVAHESDMLRGLQWVFDNRATYKIKAVNISSAVGTVESYKTSPIDAAAEQLWLNGITVVVAAGNLGTAPDAVSHPPANDPFVITVGCLDDNLTAITYTDDSLCSFSSRGVTQDGYAKPDVVAPGRRIVSALSLTSAGLATLLPTHVLADGQHIRLSGTSMAAPVVTGTAALMLQRVPSLTPNQIKGLIQSTARTYPGQAKTDSAGEVNAYPAVSNAVSGKYPVANGGLVPNSGINTTTNTVNWGSYYWDSAYWDSYYWDSYYLDVTSYD